MHGLSLTSSLRRADRLCLGVAANVGHAVVGPESTAAAVGQFVFDHRYDPSTTLANMRSCAFYVLGRAFLCFGRLRHARECLRHVRLRDLPAGMDWLAEEAAALRRQRGWA
jgi:hypothetical protein